MSARRTVAREIPPRAASKAAASLMPTTATTRTTTRMQATTKRILVIIAIIICSLIFGIATDIGWSSYKLHEHSIEHLEIVEKYSASYNVPKEIVFAVIKTESGFDQNAISSAGASGLMQMTESTFLWLTGSEHLNEGLKFEDLSDPDVSIRYGTYYISYLCDRFKNEDTGVADWNTVFAAYNGGEGNVEGWLKNPAYSNEKGELIHIPFDETRSYVHKVNEAIEAYKMLYPEIFNDNLIQKEV